MARLSQFGFLAIAVIFHVVYFYSIFDIYFVSPIVPGMHLYGVERPPESKPPADRLVLMVGDGLRADKCFQSHPRPFGNTTADLVPRPLAPFLRSRVLTQGTFGVSHTRVPTESRPGHVALIAGLYEDVSAVTTGWKLNPVNFDSVFNRSRHTWSWGSPDILPMFREGAVPGKVDTFCYGHEDEDFSADATALDHWVFDRVYNFFEVEARQNATLAAELREPGTVFFLHLLGLDTTGHSYRPYSDEYLRNLQVVDEGVRRTVEVIERFYDHDGRTAFVFTADHGMSDWGSHGDGHPDNTRTPLIVWGSGVAPPKRAPGAVVDPETGELLTDTADESQSWSSAPSAETVAPGHDDFSADWGLSHVARHDVAQADVAALMAFLVGLEFPANSVGELPLAYLAAPLPEKAEGALANAKGILDMYRVKEERKRSQLLRYRPYGPLSSSAGAATQGAWPSGPAERTAAIRALIDAGKYEEAIEESAALIKLALEGLRYLQTYDWLFLRALITLGYLGWMAYALTTVVALHVLHGAAAGDARRTTMGLGVFGGILLALYASFAAAASPTTYYAYAFFAVAFWEEVFARRACLADGAKVLLADAGSGAAAASLLFNAGVYVAVIVSLALGYIHREVLTVLFILGSFWPATYGVSFLRKHVVLSGTWFVSCLVMSTFTLLQAMKVEDVTLIVIGGALMFTVGVLYLVFEDQVLADFKPVRQKKRGEDTSLSRTLVGVQVGLVLLATVVTRSSALSLQAKQGLPRGNQVVAWLVLIVSMLMPSGHRLAPNNHYMHRLLVMFLTCAPTFVILTISYEGLFYVAFCVTLVTWVRLEREVYVFLRSRQPEATATRRGAGKQVNGSAAPKPASSPDTQPSTQPQYRPLGLGDARVALFFFVLLQSAFFSTGNVASVAAFSLDSVYRLIPVFDPFSQGALLMLKIMVPFALLSANLGILNRLLGVSPSALFMLVMAISDVLTLYFFWVVRDEGSWLEIGSTISHFAIASLLCAFVAGLEGVSQMFIAGVRVEADDDDWKRPMANDAVEPAGGPSAEKESKSGNGAAMANGSLGVFAAERIVIR